MKKTFRHLSFFALVVSILFYFPTLAHAYTGTNYQNKLEEYRLAAETNSSLQQRYENFQNLVNTKTNMPVLSRATDKNGNALVTGNTYYMLVVQGSYNPGVISNDILNSENHGITRESSLGTNYPCLASDKGVPVQLYHKDARGVDGLYIGKDDPVYLSFSDSNNFFDFPNDDSWGDITLNENPSGGVAYLIQRNDNKINFLTCSNVTWYNGSQGYPGSWPFYDGTSIRTAWFGFNHGTFQNSHIRWLATNLPAGNPWTTFKFEPTN